MHSKTGITADFFNVFAQKLPEDFRKSYIEIVGSLIQNNFNIQMQRGSALCIRIRLPTVIIK